MTLPRSFYARPVTEVARDLLGAVVERETAAGVVALRLTEVEAYDGEADPGSHAYRGQTPRNATMFGAGGHAYVYFTYGMHFCVNLVCGRAGTAAAVLLRAGAVIDGVELARERRPGVPDRDLARGPARLTRALAIDRSLDGADVVAPGSPQWVRARPAVDDARVVRTPRTGVAGAGAEVPWRFAIAGEPTVSPYRAAVPRRRLQDSRPCPS